MDKQFRTIKSAKPFITSHTGVRIDADTRCEHGQAAAFIALFGRHLAPGSPHQRIDTLVPRCVLAELLGALQAQIRHEEGEAALQEFLDAIATEASAASTALQQMRARQRDCCEAGFTTYGREHTCGRNEATP